MALIKSHIPWAIKIDNFPQQATKLIYNTEAQTPAWNFFDTEKMYISGGTTSEINAGTYYTEFLPFRKFVFPNGTKKTYYAPWTIDKAVNPLSLSATSGEVKIKFTRTFTISKLGDGEVTVTSSDPNIADVSLSGNRVTITGKKVGDVTITVNVAEGTNYLAASATYACKSRKTQITVPVVAVASKTYTGYSLSPTVYYAPSTSLVERTGTFSAYDYSPLPYSFTYRILDTDAYEWADGTTAPKTFFWYITKRVFAQPAQVGTLRYTGNVQSPTWDFESGIDIRTIAFTGDTVGIEPGTYTITIHLKYPENCEWWDGSTSDKTATWKIDRALVKIPRLLAHTLVYNHEKQTIPSEYDEGLVKLTGYHSGLTAIPYRAGFEVYDKRRYEFEDGSQSIEDSWEITPLFIIGGYNLYGNTYILSDDGQVHGLDTDFWIDVEKEVEYFGTLRTSNYGRWVITFRLKDKLNTRWFDGTTDDRKEYWEHHKLS